MSDAVFKSKRSLFSDNNNSFIDMVLGRMAMDGEVFLKTNSGMPVKTGGMKSEVRHFKNGQGHWRIEGGKNYTATQEAGRRESGPGAPTAPFKNYSTAGTSAGFFKRTIDMLSRNKLNYVNEAKEALKL